MTNDEVAYHLFIAMVYIGSGIIMLTTDVNPIYIAILAVLVVWLTAFVYAFHKINDSKVDKDDR